MAEDISSRVAWKLRKAIKGMSGSDARQSGTARVTRIDSTGTVWLRLPGSTVDTPVTGAVVASVAAGDVVSYSIQGGRVTVAGNASDPSAGTKAVSVVRRVAVAARTLAKDAKSIAEATGQHFWADDNGAHISTEDGNPIGAQNALWNSLGMLFRAGANNLLALVTGTDPGMDVYDGTGNEDGNVLASFRGSGARIGRADGAHISVDAGGIEASNIDNTKMFEVRSHADVGQVFYVTKVEKTVSWTASREDTDSFTIEIADGHQITDYRPIIVYLDYTAEANGETYTGRDSSTNVQFLGHGNPQQIMFALPYPSYTYKSGVTFTYDGDSTITVESAPYDQSDAMDECELRVLRVEYLIDDGYRPSLTYGTRSGENHGFDVTMGEGLKTVGRHQVVIGKYNDPNDSDILQIGWGDSEYRENVFTVGVNGDVSASGRVVGKNGNLLWSNAYYMTAGQRADLSESIADQPTGIVLVWSGFSGGAQNYQWHFDYIPKEWVQAHDGAGMTCIMAGAGFSPVAAKYVYIHDYYSGSYITGHAANNQSGTVNGITYNNAAYVLREVWGV